MAVDEETDAKGQESRRPEDRNAQPCCPALVHDRTPIVAIQLSQRSHYALLEKQITSVGQLAALSVQELRDIRLIDSACAARIQDKLRDYEERRPYSADALLASGSEKLAVLGLPPRTCKALEREGVVTIGQLDRLSGPQLLRIRGIELESIVEIREKRESYGKARQSVSPTASGRNDPPDTGGLEGQEQATCSSTGRSPELGPSLDVLNLSTRASNALWRDGYRTVADVAFLTDEQLLAIRQIGVNTRDEVCSKLRRFLNSCRSPGQPVSILRREPIVNLGLSEDIRAALRREGCCTVGWLTRSYHRGDLDVDKLGSEGTVEIETELEEHLKDLASYRLLQPARHEGASEPPRRRFVDESSSDKQVISRHTPIEALELPTRVRNPLRRASIRSVGDLMEIVASGDLSDVRNIGEKSVEEVEQALAHLSVVDEEEPSPKPKDAATQRVIRVPTIPAGIIDWQTGLIAHQISAGLLHEDARTGQESISSLLARVEKLEPSRAWQMLAGIIGGSLNICEELEFLIGQIKRNDYVDVLLARHGYDRETLEEIGSRIGVTRERVRQIESKLGQRIGWRAKAASTAQPGELPNQPSLLRVQSALLLAADRGLELTYEGWRRQIMSSGLVGNWTLAGYSSIDPLEAMIAVCSLLADERIEELTIPVNLQYAVELATSGAPKTRAKIARIRKTLPSETAKVVNRHARFSGAAHAEWLAQELDKGMTQMRDILRALGYEPVSANWFAPTVQPGDYEINKHDAFHHALREMFQYCGRLRVDDICSGLRLSVSRTRFPVPPPDVMVETLLRYGYQCEDGLWYCAEGTDEELCDGEGIIKDCIDEHGPVVHHSQLAEAFVSSDLSLSSLHATLRRSPIFERIDRGLYKLRGTAVTYEDVEYAESFSEKVSVEPRVEYDASGSITVTANLSPISLGFGVLASGRFPNLSGDWEYLVDGNCCGTIQATANEFRRLKDPLERLGCQPEDRVKLVFNVWDRTVQIEKVQD